MPLHEAWPWGCPSPGPLGGLELGLASPFLDDSHHVGAFLPSLVTVCYLSIFGNAARTPVILPSPCVRNVVVGPACSPWLAWTFVLVLTGPGTAVQHTHLGVPDFRITYSRRGAWREAGYLALCPRAHSCPPACCTGNVAVQLFLWEVHTEDSVSGLRAGS